MGFCVFFWKRKKKIEIIAPLTGQWLSLEQVPDQVFSKKMMGDGFAITPQKGEVVSPVDGEVMNLFPTKHAIGVKSGSGLEILIHVGIDTVELNGEGFMAHVKEGDRIRVGQKLLDFDLERIQSQGKPTVTPVIFPQSAAWNIHWGEQGSLTAGQTVVATLEPKKG
jgi:glucose-specific phosphotransferase system IIA component